MISIGFENFVLRLEDHVVKVINERCQKNLTDKESGGLLIGSILSNSNDIVIRDYTLPLIGDYQSRCRFIRKRQSHNALLQKKWEESNRTVMYLGEWHTHPEKDPHYSHQDINNWNNLLKKSNTFSEYLVFIIGGVNFYKIWMGNRKNEEITLIHKGAYDEISSNSY